jgi:hypothetical protein
MKVGVGEWKTMSRMVIQFLEACALFSLKEKERRTKRGKARKSPDLLGAIDEEEDDADYDEDAARGDEDSFSKEIGLIRGRELGNVTHDRGLLRGETNDMHNGNTRQCDDHMLPYNIALQLDDFSDLRCSGITCLGEIAAFLGASLARFLPDIIDGLIGVLLLEIDWRRLAGAKALQAAELTDDVLEALVESDCFAFLSKCICKVRRAAALSMRRVVEGGGGNISNGIVSNCSKADLEKFCQGLQLALIAEKTNSDPITRQHMVDTLSIFEESLSCQLEQGRGDAGSAKHYNVAGLASDTKVSYRPIHGVSDSKLAATAMRMHGSVIDMSTGASPLSAVTLQAFETRVSDRK